MLKLPTRAILGLLTFVVLGGGFTHQVQAMTLVPPSFEFNVKPGDTVTTKVKLFNETPSAIEAYPSTANFTAKDQTGTPSFSTEKVVTDLASWITVSAGPYVLQPGDRIEVPVTIKIPASADPGGHYAAVFFGTKPPSTDGVVGIASKIGSLIIIRVAGNIRENADLTSFGVVGKSSSFSHQPVNFTMSIRNSGNVHVRPKGSIVVKNMWGRVVGTVGINVGEGAVLPNSTRDFQVTWGEALSAKGFFGHLAAEWNHFNLGLYSADVQGSYGSTDRSLGANVTFFMFPWHLLLVEILVVLIALFGLTFGIKRYNGMIIQRSRSGRIPPTRR